MISVCPNVSESRSESSLHELIGDRGPSIAMDWICQTASGEADALCLESMRPA